MNSELVKKALEKVGNPHVLVNVVSRRVRQLTGGGGISRPLVEAPVGTGVADLALLEIIEDKMAWEHLVEEPAAEVAPKKRKKSSGA